MTKNGGEAIGYLSAVVAFCVGVIMTVISTWYLLISILAVVLFLTIQYFGIE